MTTGVRRRTLATIAQLRLRASLVGELTNPECPNATRRFVGVLPKSATRVGVGHVSPSAPSAVAQTRTLRITSAPRGALGETRPASALLGLHAPTSATTEPVNTLLSFTRK